jgi:hypothetical protein
MKLIHFTSLVDEPLLINPERVGGVRSGQKNHFGGPRYVDTSAAMYSINCRKRGDVPLMSITGPHSVLLVDGREIFVKETIDTVLERLGVEVADINPPFPDWLLKFVAQWKSDENNARSSCPQDTLETDHQQSQPSEVIECAT